MNFNKTLLIITTLLSTCPGFAQEPDSSIENKESIFSYGDKGLQFESKDGNNFLWFGVRLQTRYTNEKVTQSLFLSEPTSKKTELKLNRGRFKVGGHLFSPKLTVYTEYDFPSDRLIDLRATWRFTDWLNVRVGQWKAEFNRERFDSSGAQQFVERSIVTPWFTIDRQKALMASGRFAQGSPIDSSYWFGLLSGTGRGGSLSDAEGLWMGRYQWNFTGELLGFSQSDIHRRQHGAGSIALSLIDGDTQYTSFSSAGGGQLPGFENGAADKYHLRQLVFETAYQKNGFSWQQEFHWKSILDKESGIKQKITGGYAQAGVFLSRIFPTAPKPLEIAIRVATVDPDKSIQENYERETSVVTNWFFSGHRNKFSLDISYLQKQFVPETDSTLRVRFQWDWSF